MKNWWSKNSWRMIQTNLREVDMSDISATEYVAQLKAFGATLAMINTSGIISSYPTDLEFHFQSPFLTGDSLETIIDACHSENIRVIARTDFSKIRRPIYEMHPEWAYKSPMGEIVDYNGDVHVCMNGDYQQVYAFEILRETLTKLDVDGVFFNMGGYQVRDYSGVYHGICQCDSCRKLFDKMYSLALPQTENMDDGVYRQYLKFKEDTQRAYHQKLEVFINAFREGLCIDKAFSLDSGFVRQESNTAVKRELPHWQYSGSANTKWVVGSYPGFISSNTSVDFIDFPYRHVAVSPAQQSLRLAQSLANGGALDYYLIGRLDNHEDKTGYDEVKRVFRFHAENPDLFSEMNSDAEILLIDGLHADQNEFRGWFRVLTENHFLFDTMLSSRIETADLSRYRLIVLPNVRFLSELTCERLDAFVSSGGALVSVFETGTWDDAYHDCDRPRITSAGVRRIQSKRTDMTSSYLRLDDAISCGRTTGTSLVFLDGPYLYAEYESSCSRFFRLIPPHMYGPPERCYYTQITDHPGVVVNQTGKGKTVFVPWLPGTLFHRQGYVNTANFLADIITGILGVDPIATDLPPSVEITVMSCSTGSKTVVSLVNSSGHFGTTFYPPIPIKKASVSLPFGHSPKSVRSRVKSEDLDFSWQNGILAVHVTDLELFDFVTVES